MKKTLTRGLPFTALIGIALLGATTVWAGECVIDITRDACPGKDAEAYKPYDGKKTTQEKKKVKDEADCETFANKSAKIVRKGTLSKKTVQAAYDGKKIDKAFSDTSECK